MNSKITIKHVMGGEKLLELNLNMAVREAKEKADEINNIWIFGGKILKDEKSLFDYNIIDGSIIISKSDINEGNIMIILKYIYGIERKIELNRYMTIKEAKEKAGELTKKWTLEKTLLKDEKTLSDYGIRDDDIIISSDFPLNEFQGY